MAATPLSTNRFHVSMGDVDAAGHLFYAAPLLWAERLLTDWRRAVGQPVSGMLRDGWGSPVVRTEITYSRPLRLDDEVEGTLWFVGRSARTFTVLCRFTAGTGGPVGAEVQITQVPVRQVDGEPRATDVPAELVAQLERVQEA